MIRLQRELSTLFFLSFIIIFNVVTTSYIMPIPSIGQDTYGNPRVTRFWQDCNTTFTMSWDDVRISDVNLASIDEKYDISHTLFAPSFRSYPNHSFWRYAFLLDELFQGYDIQSHCGKHVHLSEFSKEEQEFYVKWGKTGIESLFDFTPIVFAYPYGDLG
ncbi:MAG: polysaccharide deacetylase family protein, partial [Candidatus Hodarchaeales archaeon]